LVIAAAVAAVAIGKLSEDWRLQGLVGGQDPF